MRVETWLHIHKTTEHDNDCSEGTIGLYCQMDICRDWIYLWLRQEWFILRLYQGWTQWGAATGAIKNKGPHCRLSPSPTYLSRMIIYIKKKTTNTWTHDRLKSLELHNPTHLAVKKNCCCYSRNFQSEQKSENHPPRADSTRTLCHGMCMLPSERNLSTTWWSFTGELKKKKRKKVQLKIVNTSAQKVQETL